MAKIVIAGNAVVVTSSLKLEEIKTIEKYRPKALILMGGDDKKEPVFSIDTRSDVGVINAYGATFANASHDDEKLATITMCMDNPQGDIKEWVADRLGGALMNLNKLEATLPAVLAEIEDEKAAVMESISMAQ